ncbi:MAG: plastocyanin/azurin family copper-binding protein [Actinomycetota bacterium]|nr:plastocyanin/azurin family copper-binding protein [Actinomycetota bacterium]
MTKNAIRTSIGGFAAVALLFTTAACGGSTSKAATPAPAASSPAASSPAAVTIHTFAFQPNPVKVKVGETVTWTNQDQILHTVTSGTRGKPDGMFDQKLDGVDAKAMFTFTTAGTFAYHCKIHPGMDATVEVS